ncbi:unnamed protein product [Phytophthora lilii]|uniref:Unnamed protein product n=1 Tax=Phytophthora lilii TaxID=2077276 RepID=A0A9W6U903_9STRA|nr:unnamed protein product [Phytophthora lilii]
MSNQADKVISDFISYFTQISIILKSKKEVDRFVKKYLSAGLRETIDNIINDLNNRITPLKSTSTINEDSLIMYLVIRSINSLASF